MRIFVLGAFVFMIVVIDATWFREPEIARERGFFLAMQSYKVNFKNAPHWHDYEQMEYRPVFVIYRG